MTKRLLPSSLSLSLSHTHTHTHTLSSLLLHFQSFPGVHDLINSTCVFEQEIYSPSIGGTNFVDFDAGSHMCEQCYRPHSRHELLAAGTTVSRKYSTVQCGHHNFSFNSLGLRHHQACLLPPNLWSRSTNLLPSLVTPSHWSRPAVFDFLLPRRLKLCQSQGTFNRLLQVGSLPLALVLPVLAAP